MEDKPVKHLFGIYSKKTDGGTRLCRKDGTRLYFYQRVLVWVMGAVVVLGYVGFRMAIGILIVAFLGASIYLKYVNGHLDLWHAFYIMICDSRVIALGLFLGCAFWLGEVAS